MLAEMGAEVIKLELAPDGDRVRAGGFKPLHARVQASTTAPITSSTITASSSFAIDLKKPGARELVMSMLPKFDVLVENFAPGVIKRLGFAYEDVKEDQSEDHHVLDLDGGADRTALRQGRLRLYRPGLCRRHRRHRRARSRAGADRRWRSATSRPASRPRWRSASRCSIASAPARASTSTPR